MGNDCDRLRNCEQHDNGSGDLSVAERPDEPVGTTLVGIAFAIGAGAIVSGLPFPIPALDVALDRVESYYAFVVICSVAAAAYWVAVRASAPERPPSKYEALLSGTAVALPAYLAPTCFVVESLFYGFLGLAAVCLVALYFLECARAVMKRKTLLFARRGRPGYLAVCAVSIVTGYVLFFAGQAIPCNASFPDEALEVMDSSVVEERWEGCTPTERLGLLHGLAFAEGDGGEPVTVRAGMFGLVEPRVSYVDRSSRTIFVNAALLADRETGDTVLGSIEPLIAILTSPF